MRFIAVAALLSSLTSCASTPPTPVAPEWDALPAGVAEALCARLRADALATGELTIVRITQPLADTRSLAAVEAVSNPQGRKAPAPIVNRAIPVLTSGSSCSWKPIDVDELPRHQDEMVVTLSAPIPNPHSAGEAGIFARVSLGGAHDSWYWIPLMPRKSGWTAGMIQVLSR